MPKNHCFLFEVLVFTQARIGKYKGCGVLTQLFDFVLAKQKFADLMVLSNMIDVLGKWLCFSNDQDNTIDKTIYQNLKCIQFSTLRWKTQSHYGQTMCCSIVSVCCRLFDLHATCETTRHSTTPASLGRNLCITQRTQRPLPVNDGRYGD